MENLTPHLLIKIAKELDPVTLRNLCQTDSRFNRLICEDEYFSDKFQVEEILYKPILIEAENNTKAIIFPICSTSEPFNFTRNHEIYLDQIDDLKEVDFEEIISDNNDKMCEILTKAFNNQLIINYMNNEVKMNFCENRSLDKFFVIGLNGVVFSKEGFNRSDKLCNKIFNQEQSYMDVMSRDMDVMQMMNSKHLGNKKVPQIYVIYLYSTSNDKSIGYYIGHVYIWKSPSDPNLSFIIGIRSKPSMPLLREINLGNYNVSQNILRAAYKFARETSLDPSKAKLGIVRPLKVMENIAIREGFKKDYSIDPTLLGNVKKLVPGLSSSTTIWTKTVN